MANEGRLAGTAVVVNELTKVGSILYLSQTSKYCVVSHRKGEGNGEASLGQL
jgi:hypothetical protein